jgi:hypothetical protein
VIEATIEENNKPLCWMKTTYEEHNLMQVLANEYMSPEERRREWRGQGDESTWGFRRWEMTVSAASTMWTCKAKGNSSDE